MRIPSVVSIALAALAGGATSAAAATPPAVKTGGASAVTQQTATIKGAINPHGLPTAFYFQFGATTAYGTRTTTGNAGAGTKSVAASAPLTALRPNRTYHYRLVAFSTAGTTRGADRTFKTLQIPTALALSASPEPGRLRRPHLGRRRADRPGHRRQAGRDPGQAVSVQRSLPADRQLGHHDAAGRLQLPDPGARHGAAPGGRRVEAFDR